MKSLSIFRTLFTFAIIFTLTVFSALQGHAQNSKSGAWQDLPDALKEYSQRSGQNFILDPSVRGKFTVLYKSPQTNEELLNQLAAGLMLNGFAMVKKGKDIIVMPARESIRQDGEVVESIDNVEPVRIVNLIFKPKNLKADEIMKSMRSLTSKFGELNVAPDLKSVIISQM